MKQNKIKLIALTLFAVSFLLDESAAWAQDSSFDISAGKFGGSFMLSKERPEYALSANFIDFTATHGPSGFGIEISPIAFRMEPFSKYAGISLVNLTVFHRTIKFDDSSILGPFASINWIDLQSNRPIIRTGLKFSWRRPWGDKETPATTSSLRPVFTYMDVETGLMYRDKPAFFASVSLDASVLLAIGALCLYGQAEENTKKVKPDYKDSLPPAADQQAKAKVPPALQTGQSAK